MIVAIISRYLATTPHARRRRAPLAAPRSRYLVITPCDQVGPAPLLLGFVVISLFLALLYASLPAAADGSNPRARRPVV